MQGKLLPKIRQYAQLNPSVSALNRLGKQKFQLKWDGETQVQVVFLFQYVWANKSEALSRWAAFRGF